MDSILTYETWQESGDSSIHGLSMEEFILVHRDKRGKRRDSIRLKEDAVGEVRAYINYGRWVADCPDGCGTALVVSEATPYFRCVHCDTPSKLVIFPPNADAIEKLLLKRPEAKNRNWLPGETLAGLRRENTENGIS